MSMDFMISISLDATYNKKNIIKILERGAKKGFRYFDHVEGYSYGNSPEIDPGVAANKILKALVEKIEYGPNVFTILENETHAQLWFYMSDEKTIGFSVGAFGGMRKKGYYIDFAHYIRTFLDIVEDFPVLELKTDMF